MGFSNILLRRGSALAIRVIGAQKKCHSAHLRFLSPVTNLSLHHNNISTLAKPPSEQGLIQVLRTEIKCALECDDHDRVESTPENFPFKIEDTPGRQTILLKREYCGETIKVEVHMPSIVTGDMDDDEDDGDTMQAGRSSIPLVVTVSKDSGPCLEFGVTAFPDEVVIDSMSVKPDSSEDQIPYEGPDFTSLDTNLQKAFHKYLELRGIKPLTTNFLHEYMINKDSRENLMWLKNLKEFIEK